MARPLRIAFPGAVYHVTSRGNAKQAIFIDGEDRVRFLDVLSTVVERFNWLCHSYCLMENHYYLLIETLDGNLSKGMRELKGYILRGLIRGTDGWGIFFRGDIKG
jgi:putative transposase